MADALYPREPHRPPTGRPEPRLWRSVRDRKLAGVVGGLAEVTDADPTFMRALYAMGTLLTGIVPGMVLYFLLWYIAPPRDDPPSHR